MAERRDPAAHVFLLRASHAIHPHSNLPMRLPAFPPASVMVVKPNDRRQVIHLVNRSRSMPRESMTAAMPPAPKAFKSPVSAAPTQVHTHDPQMPMHARAPMDRRPPHADTRALRHLPPIPNLGQGCICGTADLGEASCPGAASCVPGTYTPSVPLSVRASPFRRPAFRFTCRP